MRMKKKINFHDIFSRNKLVPHQGGNKKDERKLNKRKQNTEKPPRNRKDIRCSYVKLSNKYFSFACISKNENIGQ